LRFSPISTGLVCPTGAGWEDTVNVAWIADNDGDLDASPPMGPVPM